MADSSFALPQGAQATLDALGVTATAAELNFTDGVTAPIQPQIDSQRGKVNAQLSLMVNL